MTETSKQDLRGFEPLREVEELPRKHLVKRAKQLDEYNAYLFDLDGTIYSGNKLLPGVLDMLSRLREQEKSVMFVTNTTLRSKESVQELLEQLGIVCDVEEILTALCVVGMYFQEHEPQAKVLMFGEQAMKQELDRYGVETTEDARNATHVLVGLDRQFTYEKLTLGMNALRNGAKLIAANPDPFCPINDGAIPDTWSLVKALETASVRQTHHVLGKPSTYFAQKVFDKLNVPSAQCLMVGDRIKTDIRFGNDNGMYTALVLTGADSRKDIMLTRVQPDYVLASLGEIIGETRPYGQ